jgi:Cu(I)/Ag(I) efflux system membrane fusion protein
MTEIRKGLKAGQRVVASGQFLIDSEASLKGALSRLEGAATPATRDALHPGSGRVLDVDPAKGRIELDHGPMPSIRWPAMSMGFQVADPKALAGIGKGDLVEFEMRGEPDKEGDYVIVRLKKRAAK